MTRRGVRSVYTPEFLATCHAALLRSGGNQQSAARDIGCTYWVMGRAVRALLLDQGVVIQRTAPTTQPPKVATDVGEVLRVLSECGGSGYRAAMVMGVSKSVMLRRIRELRTLGWEVPTPARGRQRRGVLSNEDVRDALVSTQGHVGPASKRLNIGKRTLQEFLATHRGISQELRERWDIKLVHEKPAKGWGMKGTPSEGHRRVRRTSEEMRELRRRKAETNHSDWCAMKAQAQVRYRARKQGRSLGLEGKELEQYVVTLSDQHVPVMEIPGGLRFMHRRGGTGGRNPFTHGSLARALWGTGRLVRGMDLRHVEEVPPDPGVGVPTGSGQPGSGDTGGRCLLGSGDGGRGHRPPVAACQSRSESPPGGTRVSAIDGGLGPRRVGTGVEGARRTGRFTRG